MSRALTAFRRVAVTLWILASTAAGAAEPSFSGLGPLQDRLPYFSAAYGVSSQGPVAVGYGFNTAVDREAFRWQADLMTLLGDLPGGTFDSVANAVSSDGSVVVGTGSSSSGQEGFRWQNGSMTGLGDLAGGAFSSDALDVSADGSVVVGQSTSASGPEAFRWQSGGMAGLGDLPGGAFESLARGVSANGLVVVGEASSTSGTEAFRWENGVMTGLGDLPGGGFRSSAHAISADGKVIVGQALTHPVLDAGQAFRWEAGVMTGLGVLGNSTSVARAVSGDGSVIVGSAGFNPFAFIWDQENGSRYLQPYLTDVLGLDLTGWNLQEALAISDDGTTIVGYGDNPFGFREGWIAVIPEPSTGLLVGAGLIGLAASKRRGPRFR